jgi:hypothetical protein
LVSVKEAMRDFYHVPCDCRGSRGGFTLAAMNHFFASFLPLAALAIAPLPAFAALPNQHINRLDPAEERRWAQQVAPTSEAWVRTTPNGAAVLAAYRAAVLEARAGLAR